MWHYEKLAQDIEQSVRLGTLSPGDRIPSVRQASRQHQVSATTVVRAYLLLESRGVIESRPQSGYFVRGPHDVGRTTVLNTPRPTAQMSAEIEVSRLVLSTLRAIGFESAVALGSPYPDARPFPVERIRRYERAVARHGKPWNISDELPPGDPALIHQIARRYVQNGLVVDPNEVVITLGATEALNLCLQAVAQPGDVIAVESPTFFAVLHAVERMGMRVLEIPTHPTTGIDLDALERAMQRQRIAACLVMPNFQNPLGYQMPETNKRRITQILGRRNIPIIENGVYDELYFGSSYPGSLKTYDQRGLVLHCGSFSKSLTPASRIGWALPGRYRDQVEKLKFLNTLTTSSTQQQALARYLESGGFDHHLRRLRRHYHQNAQAMMAAVMRFFPSGTRVSQPKGGYVLWVEMPEDVDAMRLYREALTAGITVGPGRMFSVAHDYSHCLRLNYSCTWSREMDEAIAKLGRIAASRSTRKMSNPV